MQDFNWILFIAFGLVVAGIYGLYRVVGSGKVKAHKTAAHTPEVDTQIRRDVADGKLTEQEAADISKFVAVDARIYDNTNMTTYHQTLPGKIVREIREEFGSLGRKITEDGQAIYAIVRTGAATWRPLNIPMTLDEPPSKLYRALQQQEVGIVFDVTVEESFWGKWWYALLLAGVIAFIMFVVIMEVMK
jgi:hypothetical protein